MHTVLSRRFSSDPHHGVLEGSCGLHSTVMLSRQKSRGIAIVAVLISAVVFLGIMIAITGTLSISSRQSTGDQRVTLEAQYASESGLSRVMADAQSGYLKAWTDLFFKLTTPNTTQEAEIRALALKFCNLPATTVFATGCTADNTSPDIANRYELFSKYLTTANYTEVTLPSTVTAPTSDALENTFWADAFSNGPGGKRFTQTVNTNVKYDVSFGFEAVDVRVVSGNYQFKFKPRDAVSTGFYEANSKVVATRSSSRTFQDAYIIELRPPSFAYFLSLTDAQQQANDDPSKSPDNIFFNTSTLLNGPVHTNGQFNFKGQPWFSDTVSSAGCSDSTNLATCTPKGIYDNNQALTFDASGNPLFPGYTSGLGTGPEFVNQNFDDPTLRTTYTPNATGKPWSYPGKFDSGVVNFPTSSNSQRVDAIEAGILLPAGTLTPEELALPVEQRPVYPQLVMQATADNFDPNSTTSTNFGTVTTATSATAIRKQLIRVINRATLNNCRAAPTGVSIKPPNELINYGESIDYTATVTGQEGYTYEYAPTEKKVTTWEAVNPSTVTGSIGGTGNLTAKYTTTAGYAMSPTIVIKAIAGTVSDTTTLRVQATNPTLVSNVSPKQFIYGGGTSTLSWTSTGTGPMTYKVEQSLDNGGSYSTVVASTTSLSQIVTSTVTALYRVTATGPTGLVDTDSSIVTVDPPIAPKVVLTASPSNLPYGGPSTTLSWVVTGSFSVANPMVLKLTNNQNTTVTTVTGMTGNIVIPITESTRYFLTATGPGGVDSDYEDVGVALPVAPDFTLSASPTTLTYGGGNTSVTWTAATGATPNVAYTMTKTVGGVQGASAPVAGSTTVGGSLSDSPTVTTTYNVTATGPGGAVTKTVTVTVSPPEAPKVTLTALPASHPYGGGNSTLTWSSATGTGPIKYQVDASTNGGSTYVNIVPANSPSGSLVVSPTVTTRYRVTATGGTGLTDTDTKDVTVALPDPPAFNLTATPPTLPYGGGNSTLNWSGATGTGTITYQLEASTNAGSTWATLIPAGSSATTANVSPTVTTRYRVTAVGKVGATIVGTTPKEVDVTVSGPTSPTLSLSRSGSGTLVNGNNSTTLTWALTNTPTPTVTYVLQQKVGSGAWTPNAVWPGTSSTSQLVTNLTTTTSYRVLAQSSASGTTIGTSNTITLTVGSLGTPPNITSFIAVPNSGTTTINSTLSWTIVNATTATLTRVSGTGTVPTPSNVNAVAGSTVVTVPTTTYYQLSATNAFGTTIRQVVVYIGTGTVPTVPVIPPPVINTFTATPPNLAYGGGPSTLAWTITGATSAQIDQGVGPVNNVSGSKGVTVGTTTTYTLSATNAGGTAIRTVVVTVALPAPPVVTLNTPTSTYAYPGGSQTLTWSTTGDGPFTYRLERSLNGGTTWSDVISAGSGATSAAVNVGQTTVYRVTATGPGGVDDDIKTVTVNPPVAPTVTLTANPGTLPYGGGNTNLSWTATGTATITYKLESSTNGGTTWNTLIGAGSSLTSLNNVNVTASTQFRVTATNPYGVNTDTKAVSVAAATPPTVTLNASPNSFGYGGGASNLTWSATGTGTFTYQLEQSTNGTTWTPVIAAGSSATSKSVSPSVTTQYRVTATGVGGVGSDIKAITVAAAVPPTVVLAAPTAALPYGGGSANLSWTVTSGTGGFTYKLESSTDGGSTWGVVIAAGSSATSKTVNPTTTTVYKVTATGPTGLQDTDQKTVTVTAATPPTLTLNGTPLSHSFGGGASNLTWSATGTGPMSYGLEQSINGGTTWVAIPITSSTTSRTVNPTVTTIYRVTATGGTSLKDDKTVTVTIGAPLSPTVNMNATANLPSGGGNSTVTWSATGSAPITYKLEMSTNGGSTFSTVVDNTTDTSRTVPITSTTVFRVTATNPGGSSSAQKTTTVAPPPEALLSLDATGTNKSINDEGSAKAFDPGWDVTPRFSNTTGGTVPTVTKGDYVVTITPNDGDGAVTASVLNDAGKIGLVINRLPTGTPSRTYTVRVSLTENGVTKYAEWTIKLTKNSNYTMLRPKARLAQTVPTCSYGGPVQYTWPVFTDYIVYENGDIYKREYASEQQASAVAPTDTNKPWVKQPKKFNGVIYADGASAIRGPQRTNLTDPSTAAPTLASFMKITLASGSDIVINGDLKYETPVCSTAPTRESNGKVTPAVCETDTDKWKQNVLGIYTSNGNVNIRTQVKNPSNNAFVALPNLTIQAITMASQGRVEVEGVSQKVSDPACPDLLDNTAVGDLGSVNIQGGLIQKTYGPFARTDENDKSWCGYDRSMTYDTRMRDPDRAPPSFPKADNAEWKTQLYLASDPTNPLSSGTVLPLTQGFSRNK